MTSSAYFAVDLPAELSVDQLTKIYTWGQETCIQSNLIMQTNGWYLLIAQRAEERDLRSLQRLISTNLRNWGIPPPKQQKGWVRLLTKEEFEARHGGGTQDVAATAAELAQEEERSVPSICSTAREASTRCAADPGMLHLPLNLLTVSAQ